MTWSSLGKKVRLQDPKKALIVNSSSRFIKSLGEPPAGLRIDTESAGQFDFAQLFVTNRAE